MIPCVPHNVTTFAFICIALYHCIGKANGASFYPMLNKNDMKLIEFD